MKHGGCMMLLGKWQRRMVHRMMRVMVKMSVSVSVIDIEMVLVLMLMLVLVGVVVMVMFHVNCTVDDLTECILRVQ